MRREPYLQIQLMGLECVTIMEKYGLEITLGRPTENQSSMKKRSGICYNHAWGPELSIVKCDAHQKGEDKITLENNFADQTAKAAAKRETEPGKGILVLTRAQIAKKN